MKLYESYVAEARARRRRRMAIGIVGAVMLATVALAALLALDPAGGPLSADCAAPTPSPSSSCGRDAIGRSG